MASFGSLHINFELALDLIMHLVKSRVVNIVNVYLTTHSFQMETKSKIRATGEGSFIKET